MVGGAAADFVPPRYLLVYLLVVVAGWTGGRSCHVQSERLLLPAILWHNLVRRRSCSASRLPLLCHLQADLSQLRWSGLFPTRHGREIPCLTPPSIPFYPSVLGQVQHAAQCSNPIQLLTALENFHSVQQHF